MHYLKALTCYILIVLLAGCHPAIQSKQAPYSAADNFTTMIGITEYTALQLLLVQLEQRQVATDCLTFRSENDDNLKAQVWELAAFEIHDEICGGDPYVGHVRNRYKINSDGSLMRYNMRDADYEPY